MNSEPKPQNHSEKLAELSSIFNAKMRPEGKISMTKMEEVSAFVKEMKAKYEGVKFSLYKLFHLVSISTTTDDQSPEFDLPGGEIEDFIRHKM